MSKLPSITQRRTRRPAVRAVDSKTIWHPLTLQQMRASQSVSVVNGILDGRYDLCQGTLRSVSTPYGADQGK